MPDTVLSHHHSLKQSRLVHASPIFYGWVVVAAATLGMEMTLPGQTIGISLFIDSLIADLGLSRSTVSLAYTVATVAASLVLPFVGRWTDRYGPRRAVVVVTLVFALACIWMGIVQGLVTLFIGFLLLRALGPGALSLVSVHAVNLWFVRRRGTAVGCMGVGLAMAAAIFPLLVEPVLPELGWRRVFILLGVMLLAIMLPAGALLYREKPEHFGLTPDGDHYDEGDGAIAETVLSLSEARRTVIFWTLTAGGMCVGALGTGLLFHHFSIMEYNGVGRTTAAVLFLPLGFLTATANLGTGVLVDQFGPRYLLAAMLFLLGGMLVFIPMANSLAAVWAYGSIFGVVQGMQGAIMGSAYAFFFGRTHIGAIKGFARTIFVGGSALGPLIFAVGLDVFGSYTMPLILTATVPFCLGAAALLSRKAR